MIRLCCAALLMAIALILIASIIDIIAFVAFFALLMFLAIAPVYICCHFVRRISRPR